MNNKKKEEGELEKESKGRERVHCREEGEREIEKSERESV